MKTIDYMIETGQETNRLFPGRVVAVRPDDSYVVSFEDEEQDPLACELLHTHEGRDLQLKRGDRVLVWLPGKNGKRGVILGRIGTKATAPQQKKEVPNELTFESKGAITLKCGESSIILRADGKILLKGKDLVSHARRTNRIKGGAVAIN